MGSAHGDDQARHGAPSVRGERAQRSVGLGGPRGKVRGRPRRPLAVALRRARLGFVLLWRKRSPRKEEADACAEQAAERSRAREEFARAAEAYQWAVVGESRRAPAPRPGDATTAVDPVAESAPLNHSGTWPASGGRVLFLNFLQADGGTVGYDRLPRDYVAACRFLRCSIIDRTATLDQGFVYAVLDRIPTPATDGATFAELCDTVGAELVAEALRAGRTISVLWSGGIDSTSALIALMKAADAHRCADRVRVQFSLDSVLEYPEFFLRHVSGKYPTAAVSHPISEVLNPADLTVTGEHGDQLFGSHLLASYVRRGIADADYRDALPLVLVERLQSVRDASRVRRYLEPVVAAAPVPIRTLFDCLWWLNFALKWQEVTLRLPVFRGDEARAAHDGLRHFFRDDRFQAWALANTPGHVPATWARYKDAAKRYILDFTGDRAYYRDKEKADSLRNVMANPASTRRYRVLMREDFRPVFGAVDQGER
jgi:hypothetical protein